jgi:hypothetical protein
MSTLIRTVALACVLLLSLIGSSSSSIAAGTGESMDSSIEMGQAAQVGDYEVVVTGIDANATETIREADESNPAPAEGYAYFMASLDVTYKGAETGDPAYSLTFHVVGPSARGIMSQYGDCGMTIPNDGYLVETLNPGDKASFNVCWQVPQQDLGGMVMYVDPLLGTGEGIVWFSLGNAAPTFAAPAIPEGVVSANSEDDAAAVGVTGQTGEFLITVTGVQTDATETLVNADSFNEPPEEGNRYVLVTLSVTYLGEDVGETGVDLSYSGIGQSGTEYSINGDSCGIVPDSEFSTGDLFAGAVVSYNVCWQVAADDADTMLMKVMDYAHSGAEPVWFSLQQG